MAIVEVRDGGELAEARQLLEEYFASLEVDLGEVRRSEIASLPGEYAAPGGFMLLARLASEPAGPGCRWPDGSCAAATTSWPTWGRWPSNLCDALAMARTPAPMFVWPAPGNACLQPCAASPPQ